MKTLRAFCQWVEASRTRTIWFFFILSLWAIAMTVTGILKLDWWFFRLYEGLVIATVLSCVIWRRFVPHPDLADETKKRLKRDRGICLILIWSMFLPVPIKSEEQEEKGIGGIVFGTLCLALGAGGIWYLSRKCKQYFGPKPPPKPDTNAPPAELRGIWPENTNNIPQCYCDGMNEPTITNAPPFLMSFAVKNGSAKLVSLGRTNGVVVTVGEMGHWVDQSDKEGKEPPTEVLVEWKKKLEDRWWQPFVLLLAKDGLYTIHDPLTSSAAGFYQYRVVEK